MHNCIDFGTMTFRQLYFCFMVDFLSHSKDIDFNETILICRNIFKKITRKIEQDIDDIKNILRPFLNIRNN